MNEFKGTPGPWSVTGDPDSFSGVCVEAEKEGIIHWVIADRIGGHILGEEYDDYSEVEANARLIAAAPELLEALIRLSEAARDMHGYLEGAVSQAEDAIAKALGEKP